MKIRTLYIIEYIFCKIKVLEPIAVNLTVGLCPSIDEMLAVTIEEGVPVVETSAYNAAEYGKKLKETGVTWIHKVAPVEHAAAAKQGADAPCRPWRISRLMEGKSHDDLTVLCREV